MTVEATAVIIGGAVGVGLCIGQLLQWWSRRKAERRKAEWRKVR